MILDWAWESKAQRSPKQPPRPVWEHPKEPQHSSKEPQHSLKEPQHSSKRAFNAATTKLPYSISVLSAQCLLMAGTGRSKPALQLSGTQGWRADSLEGAMPAQHWANAQSMQKCSCNVCRSLSAQARAHSRALLGPSMHPWDHHPSQYHPSTHGHCLLGRGLCQPGASARPGLELGFCLSLC